MTRWEYRVLHDIALPELNALGEDGWEVVTAEFDDEGEIFSALAKRIRQGGDGGARKRGGGRRRRGGGGQGGGGGGGNIGPMS
jgi:uncharacterized membrane protein YgcG